MLCDVLKFASNAKTLCITRIKNYGQQLHTYGPHVNCESME